MHEEISIGKTALAKAFWALLPVCVGVCMSTSYNLFFFL